MNGLFVVKKLFEASDRRNCFNSIYQVSSVMVVPITVSHTILTGLTRLQLLFERNALHCS